MKKNKTTKKTSKALDEKAHDDKITDKGKSEKTDSLDDEDQGFGGWLKSEDGQDTMKLFVVANSIVLLTTLAYPHVQTVLDIVYDAFYGPDALYPMEVTY
ncbi:uncharacterized protein LOC113226410 [Hyposmocoma kahamanoa]|uniref:uncharacterized protein LOC113226410 n=1 Tax=Hyposmocoma kahamanoa TaxID=1477025 RepID=UPI000E6D5D27|nr:uncharacterized protein LOC113226410 [Hyposmocoma kahamanoa]